ncbi:MAG TPA: KH domain-containing protein [Patescibacteria group bacterium]|nr:KH domain-containing protein [Patescibacteria group bacterium]
MKSLLEYILIHLVDNPDAVAVSETEEDGSMVYTITVEPADFGRVIGKNGRIINSIRSIAKVRAIKDGTHVFIRMAESEGEVI